MDPSKDLLQRLLAAAPDALLAVEPGGEIVFVNDQAAHLFGWSKEELLGQQIETLVPVELLDAHVAHRARYLADPQSRPMGAIPQLLACKKDGAEFPADISLSSVTDELGTILVLAAVRDATERLELAAERQRRALAEQREQSHRLDSLGQLAGGVAHDFNNLLGVILNYQTLIARRVTDAQVVADLGEIRAAASRGAALTRRLLLFARQDVVHPEPVDVVKVIRDVAAMLENTLGEDIDLQLHVAEHPLIAFVDPYELQEIILNLAINARDAMPQGGVLTIAAEPSTDDESPTLHDAIMTVSDTGTGMPADVVARAFEPFFTTKPPGLGTGLGLSTVYGIVRRSGGTVTLDSTEGVGTVVTVRLPGAEMATPAPRDVAEISSGGNERILFVDDEPALRVGTARLLAENGYGVAVASDGVEALELFDRSTVPFDVVVTDLAMPRMRGDELASRLAQRDPNLPVIFTSGYDSTDAVLPGRRLSKPVAADTLLRSIREVIDV